MYFITDIFNNSSINNNTDLIVIQSKFIEKLLIKYDSHIDGCSIYGYNIELIKKVLHNYDLDFNNFNFLYHIYHNQTIGFPKYILMGNKLVCPVVGEKKKLKLIDNFGSGNLWCPCKFNNCSTYYPFGLLYFKNEPCDLNLYSLINRKYLIQITDIIYTTSCLNKYHSATHPYVKSFDILKNNTLSVGYDAQGSLTYLPNIPLTTTTTNFINGDSNNPSLNLPTIKLVNSRNPFFKKYSQNNISNSDNNNNNNSDKPDTFPHINNNKNVIYFASSLIFIVIICLILYYNYK